MNTLKFVSTLIVYNRKYFLLSNLTKVLQTTAISTTYMIEEQSNSKCLGLKLLNSKNFSTSCVLKTKQ